MSAQDRRGSSRGIILHCMATSRSLSSAVTRSKSGSRPFAASIAVAPFEQENNYLFGEGGAGCFSDGKLTCRMLGPDVDWVLERFVECGGRESLIYEHRPHLGSNKLPLICRNFRHKIEALGGEYRFNCRLEGLQIEQEQLSLFIHPAGLSTHRI